MNAIIIIGFLLGLVIGYFVIADLITIPEDSYNDKGFNDVLRFLIGFMCAFTGAEIALGILALKHLNTN